MTATRGSWPVPVLAWIVVGAWLEERDLVAEFGQACRDYELRVPRLIPGLRSGT